MLIDDRVMNGQERISFMLRSLYSQHGYERYRMSKFEEYDLYSRNKDFLFSEGVITFTDTTGRLMALKPDVAAVMMSPQVKSAGSAWRNRRIIGEKTRMQHAVSEKFRTFAP